MLNINNQNQINSSSNADNSNPTQLLELFQNVFNKGLESILQDIQDNPNNNANGGKMVSLNSNVDMSKSIEQDIEDNKKKDEENNSDKETNIDKQDFYNNSNDSDYDSDDEDFSEESEKLNKKIKKEANSVINTEPIMENKDNNSNNNISQDNITNTNSNVNQQNTNNSSDTSQIDLKAISMDLDEETLKKICIDYDINYISPNGDVKSIELIPTDNNITQNGMETSNNSNVIDDLNSLNLNQPVNTQNQNNVKSNNSNIEQEDEESLSKTNISNTPNNVITTPIKTTQNETININNKTTLEDISKLIDFLNKSNVNEISGLKPLLIAELKKRALTLQEKEGNSNSKYDEFKKKIQKNIMAKKSVIKEDDKSDNKNVNTFFDNISKSINLIREGKVKVLPASQKTEYDRDITPIKEYKIPKKVEKEQKRESLISQKFRETNNMYKENSVRDTIRKRILEAQRSNATIKTLRNRYRKEDDNYDDSFRDFYKDFDMSTDLTPPSDPRNIQELLKWMMGCEKAIMKMDDEEKQRLKDKGRKEAQKLYIRGNRFVKNFTETQYMCLGAWKVLTEKETPRKPLVRKSITRLESDYDDLRRTIRDRLKNTDFSTIKEEDEDDRFDEARARLAQRKKNKISQERDAKIESEIIRRISNRNIREKRMKFESESRCKNTTNTRLENEKAKSISKMRDMITTIKQNNTLPSKISTVKTESENIQNTEKSSSPSLTDLVGFRYGKF